MQGWEHFQERAQWNAIPWGFPQAWNYFRGIRHARNPWKQERQLTQPPNQPRKWTTWQNQWQPNIHTCFLLKENGRNRKEECKGWEHFQERAQWNAIPWDFPQVWNYFGGIRRARNPWKQKRQLTQPPNQPRKCTKHDKTSDNQT